LVQCSKAQPANIRGTRTTKKKKKKKKKRVYLGRLSQAHNIDPAGHQPLHDVIHGCIGVGTSQDRGEGKHRPAIHHDLNES